MTRQRSRTRRAPDLPYQIMVESAPHGIVMVDRSGTILLVNREIEQLFGYGRGELLGQSIDLLVPLPVRARHPDLRARFFAHPQSRPLGSGRDLHGRRKDGTEVPVEIGLNPIETDEGLFVLAAVVDIRARKKAEEELRESQERFRALIENSSDAVLALDAEANVLYASASLERVLGHRPEEVVGHRAFEFVHPDDLEYTLAKLAECLAAPRHTVQAAFRARHKDGSWRHIDLAGTNRLDEPAVRAVVTNFRDITALRRAQDQFFKAQRMEAVGRLSGGIAHDFNNLLTAITGHSELLLEELRPGDPLREDLTEILKAGQRAAALTRQLLAFSRRQVLEPRVVDLNVLVADLDKMLRRLIGEDIEFRTVLAADLGAVRADPGQLEQVFMNLAVNSRDAMPAGGKLTIETANTELDEAYAHSHEPVRKGEYVMLAVSDTGTGMSDETKARIFEPFFTTKEAGKGTGLGLATVYGIVKQSGGYIWVYSELGKGTTFKVYLPRVAERPEALPPRTPATGPAGGTETVLLVEDEDMVRSLARTALAKRGYQVLEAANGGEALLLCERHRMPVHLMISDVVMPGMGGRDLAARLQPSQPGMKVLYISGYTDNAVAHHGEIEPGTAFLQKPFTPDALARKVREVLDAK